MYNSSISTSRPTYSASAPQRTATPLSDGERAFVRELVQVNNARGLDGIRGREGESVAWLEETLRNGHLGRADNTELVRQQLRQARGTSEQPTLQTCAASACIRAIKGAPDLKRAIRFINSHEATPKFQASLKSAAALAILRVRSEDDKILAMAVAEERAANGTHLFALNRDHGPFNTKKYRRLSLKAAEGVLGDLAAGEAHIGSVIGQFGLFDHGIRDGLQWRAVNGAAGKAVEAGMPFEEALLKYGFHYGHASTRALKSKADAARMEGNRRAT